MLNEAELIENEITIRDMRLTKEVLETRRSIARWLALSLGIINPGESRLSAVAVLDALLYFQFIKKIDPDVGDLTRYISTNWQSINEKTLRYHLLRLKKMGIIENSQTKFYFKTPSTGEKYDVELWANSLFKEEYNNVISKVKEAVNELKNKPTQSE
ncbi:MAG: hypothetical protein ACP5JN_01365 [Candidatus Micrarchaeia archaeon]|jgi:DNA-binding transcriptional ArsR family regulator